MASAMPRSAGGSTRASSSSAYVDPSAGARRAIEATGLRLVARRRERLGQRGRRRHPRRDRGARSRPSTTSRTGSTSTSAAAPPTRRRSAEAVVARGADVGFALDGDADRLIAVDAAGRVVDGDQVLGILALDRLARGALPGGLVVSILSNGGLQAAVEAAGGEVIRTPVGDKYILEGMQVSGADARAARSAAT